MDLPKDTPAGGTTASAFAADGEAASCANSIKNPVENHENMASTPVIVAAEATSGANGGGAENISRTPGRTTGSSFVLGAEPRAGDGDSTQKDYGRTETGALPSSDAQGRTKMIKRNLPSIGAIVGVGVLSLALHSCGQKPAPAETIAAESSSDIQAMRVTRVAVRDLSEAIEATGRLVVREEAAVGSELPGYRVAQVYVDEGDWVKQGQALARLDDALLQAQIAQAEATLATQKASADFKKSQLDRAEMLQTEGALSREQLDMRRMEWVSADAALLSAKAAVNEMKVRSSRMTLRAPVAGAVLQRSIRPGDISGGSATPYFRIARDGLIELDAELPSSKLSQVKEGDTVQVTLATGEVLAGKVRFVSPRVDENTSLGRARIELPFDKALRPGSYASANFNGNASGILTVPASAIRYEAGGPAVMVVDEKNKVSRVPVKTGERTGDYVQLVEGPAAGSRVLAVGAAFTLDGDVIAPVEEGVAKAPSAPGGK